MIKFNKEEFFMMLDSALNQPLMMPAGSTIAGSASVANPMLQQLLERARVRKGTGNGLPS